MFAGVMYLAAVVSRLIGLTLMHSPTTAAEAAPGVAFPVRRLPTPSPMGRDARAIPPPGPTPRVADRAARPVLRPPSTAARGSSLPVTKDAPPCSPGSPSRAGSSRQRLAGVPLGRELDEPTAPPQPSRAPSTACGAAASGDAVVGGDRGARARTPRSRSTGGVYRPGWSRAASWKGGAGVMCGGPFRRRHRSPTEAPASRRVGAAARRSASAHRRRVARGDRSSMRRRTKAAGPSCSARSRGGDGFAADDPLQEAENGARRCG
jgi:hypothetical protein